MIDIFSSVIDYYMQNINYFTVTLLMTIESSFVPFPSEVIVPPAAWKAAQGELNVILVAFCGILGSVIGAVINYIIAITLGRTVVYRFADTKIAKMLLINRKSLNKAEQYFIKYGKSSTFIGRLVPAVRQLISAPAGLAKMNIMHFLLYTTLGTAIWNIILSILGYYAYSNKQLLSKYYKELSYICLFIGVIFIMYIIFNNIKNTRGKSN